MISCIFRFVLCVAATALASQTAQATITHVQDIGSTTFASDTSGAETTLTIPVASAVATGDLIVLEMVFGGLQSSGIGPPFAVTVADSRGNAYIGRGSGQSGFGSTLQTLNFVATAASALEPGDEITMTFTPGTQDAYTAIAAAQEFSGASIAADGVGRGEARSSGITTSFDTADNGLLVTTNADDLLLGFVAVESDAVNGVIQTSSPPLQSATLVQADGLSLYPLYAVVSATGQFSLAGSFDAGGALPPFIVSIEAVTAASAPSAANLTVSKHHTGNFFQGQAGATYTLTVVNTGSASASGTISVTDTLPAGLSFVSAGAAGWDCSAAGQTVTCIDATTPIDANQNSVITLAVDVAADAPSSVVNQASVACTAPCTTSGNPASDPTVIAAQTPVGASAEPAPTLRSFALGALIVLLAAAALLAQGRFGRDES
jgi:uncharacterized repeat protein (TIGR01451 family)